MTSIDALFLSGVLIFYVLGRIKESWLPALRIAALAWLIINLISVPCKVISFRLSKKMFLDNLTAMDTAWVDTQKWANKNTPANTMFLAPLDGGFRVFSKRPVLVEWPDMAAAHWQKDFERIWLNKLSGLGYSTKTLYAFSRAVIQKHNPLNNVTDPYENINEDQLLKLSQSNDIGFVVVRSTKKLYFPLRYENAYFRIYEISHNKM